MLDFSISGGQLMLIWAFAGAICCLPFFIKKRWQYFVTVPIIFLSIYISFITNYEFIGKPLYERPPSKFVYQYHSVIYEKGERWIILWALQNKENRLYKFPWTEENEDSLDQARRNQEQFGIPQMGEVIPKKEGDRDKRSRNNEFTLKSYKFPFQEIMPK